jgi:hypothetical protein
MCEHPDYDGDFGSIVGSKRTRDLADDPPSGGIATDFDYIKSPLGGYGLYYRSPMVAMGLVYPAPENGQRVDLPTERAKSWPRPSGTASQARATASGTSGPRGSRLEPSLPTERLRAPAAFGMARRTSTGCAMSTSTGAPQRRAPLGAPP